MAHLYRATKSGLAREAQAKIDSSFDPEEARKCLEWVKVITREDFTILDTDERYKMMEYFYSLLKDGTLLCKLINELLPPGEKLDFNKKAFQETKNSAFKAARERERIGIFLIKTQEFGVHESNRFQTDYLYERSNLVQVCTCIRNLGTEAQTRSYYNGPYVWPKKAEENKRHFSDEQLKASAQIINLQYGTNKGASQAGMSFGKQRMIID